MKNIKRCIEHMRAQFGRTWEASGEMPEFMLHMLKIFQNAKTPANVRILLIKIVSNHGGLFKSYAKHWFLPLCRFIRDMK